MQGGKPNPHLPPRLIVASTTRQTSSTHPGPLGILGIALASTILPGLDDPFQDKRTPVILSDLVHDIQFRIFKTVTDKFRHRHSIEIFRSLSDELSTPCYPPILGEVK